MTFAASPTTSKETAMRSNIAARAGRWSTQSRGSVEADDAAFAAATRDVVARLRKVTHARASNLR